MIKIRKLATISSAFLIVFIILIAPMASLADDSGTAVDNTKKAEPVKIYNPLGDKIEIPALIKKVLTGAIKIFIPVVALAIIYCGFLFVFAMGNSEKLKKAKDALLYTLIGTAILFGAWAIATLIVNTIQALDK